MDLLGLLLLLAAGLALFLITLVAHTLLYFIRPPRRTYSWAVARNLPGDPREATPPNTPPFEYEETTFRAGARTLPLWDIRGRDPAGPTVIITHGWADSRVTMLPRLPPLAAHARRVLIWDLPGHGDAPGICRHGAGEDQILLALIQHTIETEPTPAPLALYGFSLGAGISIDAAAQLIQPAPQASAIHSSLSTINLSVIAESPYRTPLEPVAKTAARLHAPRRINVPIAMAIMGLAFARDPTWASPRGAKRFDRAQLAKKLTYPLLVIHGEEDDTCSPEGAREIAESAPQGKFVLIKGAIHANLWTNPETRPVIEAEVTNFLVTTAETQANAQPSTG